MREIRYYKIEGKEVPLVISDEAAALSEAKAQGRAALGIMTGDEFLPVSYVTESLEDVDDVLAERVIRRCLGLPWLIAETERLVIREFQEEDWEQLERMENETFLNREMFCSYIRSQYSFFEYGMWAVVEKRSSRLIGRAGVWDFEPDRYASNLNADYADVSNLNVDSANASNLNANSANVNNLNADYANVSSLYVSNIYVSNIYADNPPLEIGYHIFAPYRRMGYAKEACRAILKWHKEEESVKDREIFARIQMRNEASVQLAKALGITVYLYE